MNYLYHRVPDNMQGTVIYPGNMLVQKNPEMTDIMEKYKDRTKLIQSTIPGLDCLWNDVIFLSATHPEKVINALVSAWAKKKTKRYFRIDPKTLEEGNTRIYLGKKGWLYPENFEAYSVEKLQEYDCVPDETIAYYRAQFGSGKRPLMFYRMPHIVYKGTIETKDLEIIEV